jgi:hypothetical protein
MEGGAAGLRSGSIKLQNNARDHQIQPENGLSLCG